MEIKKSQKNPQNYMCIFCDYITSSKKDYNKHVLTLKHQKQAFGTNMEIMEMKKIPKCICECNKKFMTQSGLWKHKQKCFFINNSNNSSNYNNNMESEEEVKMLSNLVMEVVKQNKELVNQNQELTNKLFESFNEVIKHGTNNTLINNNSNNKTFNLNVFLNEECKDAMNIMDFVDSLKLQLSDLENVGKLGYIEGISNIIVKNLKALDIHKRPVHCSDSKREVMYIKDQDRWEKENEDKNKLRKVIKYIAHKNSKLIPKFREKYPDCNKGNSKKSDQYNKLVIEAMGGSGDNDLEKENKIIKKIAKEVIIEK